MLGPALFRADAGHGREANALFEDVFGVPRRPERVAKQLENVGQMLDNGDLPAARKALDTLTASLGEAEFA